MNDAKIDRRIFLGAGAAVLITGANRAWASETKPGAVVDTTSGKIRGLVIDKVNAFKGIRYALQDRMSSAFARTGNPNHKGLPGWPAFDMTKRATMVLNNECTVVNDPNGEESQLVASLRRA